MSENVLTNFKSLFNLTHIFDKLKHLKKKKETYFWVGKTERKHENIAVFKKRSGKLNNKI